MNIFQTTSFWFKSICSKLKSAWDYVKPICFKRQFNIRLCKEIMFFSFKSTIIKIKPKFLSPLVQLISYDYVMRKAPTMLSKNSGHIFIPFIHPMLVQRLNLYLTSGWIIAIYSVNSCATIRLNFTNLT